MGRTPDFVENICVSCPAIAKISGATVFMLWRRVSAFEKWIEIMALLRMKLFLGNVPKARFLAILGGALSSFLGLSVLFGWLTHNISLIQVSVAFAPMQFNADLGFPIKKSVPLVGAMRASNCPGTGAITRWNWFSSSAKRKVCESRRFWSLVLNEFLGHTGYQRAKS